MTTEFGGNDTHWLIFTLCFSSSNEIHNRIPPVQLNFSIVIHEPDHCTPLNSMNASMTWGRFRQIHTYVKIAAFTNNHHLISSQWGRIKLHIDDIENKFRQLKCSFVMIRDFALTEIEWGNAMTEKGQVHAFQIKIYIVKMLIRIQFDSTAVHNRFTAHLNAKLIVPINSKPCVGCMCVCVC